MSIDEEDDRNVDCEDCIGCEYCTGCIGCTNCEDCVNCAYCTDLIGKVGWHANRPSKNWDYD